MMASMTRIYNPMLVSAAVVASASLLMISGCAPFEEEILPTVEETATDIPLPDPFVSMSAIRNNKSINLFGQVAEARSKIFRNGYKVRSESIDTVPPVLTISDYEENKEYRLHEGDHIYFEMEISDNILTKAQRDGLIPIRPNPTVESWRISLGERSVNGHPVEIVLVTEMRKVEIRGIQFKKFDYTLRFEALDLGRQPVRIAYNQTDRILVVLDYEDIQREEIKPELLEIPDSYLSFTPY
jgi:hypothetical protein